MDAAFWHQKWANKDIAFHEGEANALLVKHFDQLALPAGSRVFVPLCGKTRDIAWLLSRGYRVVGAELSPLAVTELFAELGIQAQTTTVGPVTRCSAPDIDIYVGDIFLLSPSMLGPVDAVYDRAALVALPESMRPMYANRVQQLSCNAPQLLICFEYDQSILLGPPFSISDTQVQQYYGNNYELTLLDRIPVAGGLKGKCAANENTWLLLRKSK
jgi:thiopurine S-methyltransferase